MARLLVVAFNNNSEAEAFKAAAGTPTGLFLQHLKDGVATYDYLTEIEVMAEFMKPTLWCACPPKDATKDFVRGEKWGLYVCKRCAKPQKGQWQYPKDLIHADVPARDRNLHIGIREF